MGYHDFLGLTRLRPRLVWADALGVPDWAYAREAIIESDDRILPFSRSNLSAAKALIFLACLRFWRPTWALFRVRRWFE